MALKSIIDIDVDDSKFQRFQDQFNRYTELLKRQPEIWKRIGGMHQQHEKSMVAIVAAVTKMTQQRRQSVVHMEAENKEVEHSSRLWTSIKHSTQDVAGNIESGARGLMKWATLLGGIGAGLLGIGGLLGFDKLAGTISGQRRTATGLGMSIGEQQAFGTDFGRFLNTDSFMGWVAGMQQDISKQAPAMALLGHPLSGTSADYLQMLDAIRAFARQPRFKGQGLSMLGPVFGAYGLDLSQEDQRRLRDMSDTEYQSQRGAYLADAQRLNIPDRGAMAFQNFTTQMERVAQQMRASLGPALQGLTGPLTRLSEGMANALAAFLKTDAVRDGINSLAKGLNEFATYLGSEAFKEDVRTFGEGLHDLASFVSNPIGSLGAKMRNPSQMAQYAMLEAMPSAWGAEKSAKSYFAYLADLDKEFKLPPGTLERIKWLESGASMDPNITNKKSGALGLMQLMPATADRYGASATDPTSSAIGAGLYMQDLLKRFHGDLAKALAAYNGAKDLDQLIAAHPANWQKYLPAETQSYLNRFGPMGGVKIVIENNTGGSATASVSALGATAQ